MSAAEAVTRIITTPPRSTAGGSGGGGGGGGGGRETDSGGADAAVAVAAAAAAAAAEEEEEEGGGGPSGVVAQVNEELKKRVKAQEARVRTMLTHELMKVQARTKRLIHAKTKLDDLVRACGCIHVHNKRAQQQTTQRNATPPTHDSQLLNY